VRVLLTNDDGILAPGIQALYQAVADLAEVEVVAPETSQSAIGHAISVRTPLAVRRVDVNGLCGGWSVDGRPADCVKLALVELLRQRPDFVLSGINAGANTGINVLYSGTVAGAIEGAFFGIPSLAFSLELSDPMDFRRAGQIARLIFQRVIASRPTPHTCLSINIPALDRGWPRGVRCCPQGTVSWEERYEKQLAAEGHTVYSLDGRMPDVEAEDGSDQAALAQRYVTITPLRFNLTDQQALAQLTTWDWPQTFC